MIRIITDSLSDFTPSDAQDKNIDVMPLSVRFGEESYLCGYEITNEEFYEKLVSSKESPSTAAVIPYDFEKKFKEYLEQGDEIIAILFTKNLSATYQSAVIAKNNLDSDKIHLIDTENASVAQGVLVQTAINMRDEGKSVDEIVSTIEDILQRAHIFIVLDTLEYLKCGGRISPSVAFVGGVLGLHPVIEISKGKLELIDKVKGTKAMSKWLVNKVDSLPVDENYPVFIGHSNAKEKADSLCTMMKDKSFGGDIPTYCIGSSIGTHVGPDAIAIGYISKE